jgi:hypothetical protein
MKKIFALTFVFIAAFSINSFAQGQQMSPEQRKQMMKDRLKTELQLEDAVADSVVTYQMSFQPKQREIFQNQELSQEQKQEKGKALNDEMMKGLKKYLTEDQMKKYADYVERMRQQRANRGGGK